MMPTPQPAVLWRLERSVRSQLDVAVAVYLAREGLAALGLSEIATARIATVISELATNAVRYAGHGLVQASLHSSAGPSAGPREAQVVVRDSGPGIADVAAALCERHSTGGSLGLGLPAVQRMASSLDIHTEPAGGTVVTARFWLDSKGPTER